MNDDTPTPAPGPATPAPVEPGPPIPVMAVISAAFSIVLTHLGDLFRAGLPMLVISLLVFVGFNVWVGSNSDLSKVTEIQKFMGAHSGDMVIFFLVSLFAFIVTYVAFATKWYRFTMRWPELDPVPVDIRWYKPDWAFFGYMALLGLILLAIYWTLAGVLGVAVGMVSMQSGGDVETFVAIMIAINLVMGLAAAILFLRYSFVFPAVSVGLKSSLAQSWRETKGNWGRLFMLFFIVMVLSGLLGGAGQLVMLALKAMFSGMGFDAAGAALYGTVIAQVLANVANIVLTGVAFSAHALAYRHVTRGDVLA